MSHQHLNHDGGDDYLTPHIKKMRAFARNSLGAARKSGRLVKDTDAVVASAVRTFERNGGVAACESDARDEIWEALLKHLNRKINTEASRLRNIEVRKRIEPDDPDQWAALIADDNAAPDDPEVFIREALRLLEGFPDPRGPRIADLLMRNYTLREIVEETGITLHHVRAVILDMRAWWRDQGFLE